MMTPAAPTREPAPEVLTDVELGELVATTQAIVSSTHERDSTSPSGDPPR